MIQNEMIIPEWSFKEEQANKNTKKQIKGIRKQIIKKQIKKIYNPKTLQHLAGKNIELGDKKLDKEIAKEVINPYFFIDENLKIGFIINLESHNINHANFLLNIIPNFPDIGFETRYINKILKEMATVYARLIN